MQLIFYTTVNGFFYMVRIVQDPAKNGQRYCLEVMQNYEKALKINPENKLARQLQEKFYEGDETTVMHGTGQGLPFNVFVISFSLHHCLPGIGAELTAHDKPPKILRPGTRVLRDPAEGRHRRAVQVSERKPG